MSVQNPSNTIAKRVSATTLTDHQYGFVRVNTSDLVIKGSAATQADLYVLMNTPAESEIAELAGQDGQNVKVQIGATGALAIGVEVTCDSNGRAVAAATGNVVRGIVLEAVAAGVAGRYGVIQLTRYIK